MTETRTILVEVAYAEPQRQFLRALRVPVGSTVAQVIAASGVERECGIDTNGLSVGLWSKPVARDVCVREGDRVEIYRPLKIDPKEARRLRAPTADACARTMPPTCRAGTGRAGRRSACN